MWSRLRNEQGSQIVEFALIAPILIYLVLMVPILGMAVRAWVVVEGAARESARVLAVTGDAARACEAAYLEVTYYGQLPPTGDGRELFNRSFIAVNAGTGAVKVDYHQPTYLPGISLLLNGQRMSDYFYVTGSALFRPEYAVGGAPRPDRWEQCPGR